MESRDPVRLALHGELREEGRGVLEIHSVQDHQPAQGGSVQKVQYYEELCISSASRGTPHKEVPYSWRLLHFPREEVLEISP